MNLGQAIEDIQRLRENDSLSSKVECQAIENILKSFARTIVEQSVPKTLDEGVYLSAGTSWNLCRSQTLSNADNLLK